MSRRKNYPGSSGNREKEESRIRKQDGIADRKTIIRYIKRGMTTQTWSSRMPPYCYTELCPDARYRPGYMQEVMPCEENATPAYAGHV